MNCLRWFGECLGTLSLPSATRRVGIPLFGVFFLAGACISAARGELITFTFSGTVTSVSVESDSVRNIDFPDIGDSVTGFYIFDSNAPDAANSTEQGIFYTFLPEKAMVVSIGKFQFEGASSGISIFKNLYEVVDVIPSIELTSNPEIADILDRNNFSLVVGKENLFPNPNILPLTPPSLVGASAGVVMYLDSSTNTRPWPYVTILATLDSLTIVPEPSILLLVVFVLVFSIVPRRRTY